jgi:hypothetical protein
MNPTLVNVSVPFFIEFVRRRCRNAESEIFWEDGTIAIRAVTGRAGACRLSRVSGRKGRQARIHLVSRYLPGPWPNERRDAACRLLVCGTERIEDEVDLLRRRLIQVTFASRAQADAGLRSHRDACEICAGALVRRAVAAMGPPPFGGLEPAKNCRACASTTSLMTALKSLSSYLMVSRNAACTLVLSPPCSS